MSVLWEKCESTSENKTILKVPYIFLKWFSQKIVHFRISCTISLCKSVPAFPNFLYNLYEKNIPVTFTGYVEKVHISYLYTRKENVERDYFPFTSINMHGMLSTIYNFKSHISNVTLYSNIKAIENSLYKHVSATVES